jgi:Flp pilus assembly protein TadG
MSWTIGSQLRQRGLDRGAAAIEVAILAPALLAMIMLAVVAMRIETADQVVDSSAHDAARAASLARNGSDAHAAATSAASGTLRNQGLDCSSLTVNVDTHEFSRAVGEAASVSATVTCVVDLSDLIPGAPGSKKLTSTFTSEIDQYNGRS